MKSAVGKHVLKEGSHSLGAGCRGTGLPTFGDEGDEVAPFSPKTSTDLCVYLRGYKAIVLCHLGAIFFVVLCFFLI